MSVVDVISVWKEHGLAQYLTSKTFKINSDISNQPIMHTYNIGFSGSSTEMFHRLLEIADGLKMLEGIKVAVVTTIKTKDELLAIEGVSFV